MREWFTAAEISGLGLPDLPGTERAVQLRAARENWPHRARNASGGGREYPLSALPLSARTAYVARHLTALPAVQVAAEYAVATVPAAATPQAVEQRDGRLAILQSIDAFIEKAGVSQRQAELLFCQGYTLGKIDVPDWVRACVPSVTPRTIARWRAALAQGDLGRLAVDRGVARRGKGMLETANEGAVKTFCLGLLVTNPLLTADHIRRAVGGEFGGKMRNGRGDLIAVPPLRTFQEALKLWKTAHKVDLIAATNPDAYKSRYKFSGRDSFAHIQRVNQLWMIDASPVDMMCVDGRYNVYVAIDVYSRRLIAYITRTPRAEGVALLMRRALMAWGVPDQVKTDNGSDFVARSTQALFRAINVGRVTSAPFAPEEKAFVERAIGTYQHKFVRTLKGFIGHSVADRKVIEARKSFAQRLGEDPREALCVELDATEVQRLSDEWIRLVYEQDAHEGLGRRTPAEVARASTDEIRMVDERALDVLLAPIAGRTGLRTVTKTGLRIDNRHYLTPPHIQPETEVLVRMDPMDLGRVLVFTANGLEYLGDAICPAVEGIDPRQAVNAVKRAQAEFMAERLAPLKKEARRIGKGPGVTELILRHAARDAGKLVELPRPKASHTTPQLDAAAQAVQMREALKREIQPPQRPALPQDVMQLRARLLAEQMQDGGAEVRVIRERETPKQRYMRAVALEKRVTAGETPSADELQWLIGYVQSAEYKAHKATYGALDDLHQADQV